MGPRSAPGQDRRAHPTPDQPRDTDQIKQPSGRPGGQAARPEEPAIRPSLTGSASSARTGAPRQSPPQGRRWRPDGSRAHPNLVSRSPMPGSGRPTVPGASAGTPTSQCSVPQDRQAPGAADTPGPASSSYISNVAAHSAQPSGPASSSGRTRTRSNPKSLMTRPTSSQSTEHARGVPGGTRPETKTGADLAKRSGRVGGWCLHREVRRGSHRERHRACMALRGTLAAPPWCGLRWRAG